MSLPLGGEYSHRYLNVGPASLFTVVAKSSTTRSRLFVPQNNTLIIIDVEIPVAFLLSEFGAVARQTYCLSASVASKSYPGTPCVTALTGIISAGGVCSRVSRGVSLDEEIVLSTTSKDPSNVFPVPQTHRVYLPSHLNPCLDFLHRISYPDWKIIWQKPHSTNPGSLQLYPVVHSVASPLRMLNRLIDRSWIESLWDNS